MKSPISVVGVEKGLGHGRSVGESKRRQMNSDVRFMKRRFLETKHDWGVLLGDGNELIFRFPRRNVFCHKHLPNVTI